jgi:predicted AAA+ superfamily ATPase
MRAKTMLETKISPVEEMVHEDEFTDRVEMLRELDQWVKAIGRMGSWSTALIAPRRIGKTVLLDRFVNTVFFKPEYQVAPFYFKMTREQRTLRNFLLEYATTFFRQYLAYCEQDADSV